MHPKYRTLFLISAMNYIASLDKMWYYECEHYWESKRPKSS